jgi:Flp pilus assembly pilin Flp
MYRARLHAWRDDRGAAVIEFALIVPLLLLLLFGIIDMSRAFYTLNNLASAVREGARRGAVADTRPDLGTIRDSVRQTVMRSFLPIGPALRQDDVFVTLVGGRQVKVEAVYPFAPLLLTNWKFPVTRNAIFRWEQAP